jgi:zinc protease
MMIPQPTSSAHTSDELLWQRSRAGDREAFGRIVERYQTLVCSLAYSASGSLAQSEDLAQETFITAWQRVGELRDPSKLKAWLCGIARNAAASAHRKESRRGRNVSLDDIDEPAAAEADPLGQVVSQQEETLVWNCLAQLPASCREAMVLYYRHGNSIAEAAATLDLSEEAFRQRLSRGRALLRQELSGVVAATLARSRPGIGFTVGVLAALPVITPPSATAAMLTGTATANAASAQGAMGGKGVIAGMSSWVLVGPLIGLVIGLLATRAVVSTGRSERERSTLRRHARRMVIYAWLMSIGLAAVLMQAGKLYAAEPIWIVVCVLAWTAALVGYIVWSSERIEREVARIRIETGTTDEALGATGGKRRLRVGPIIYRSRLRLLGLPLLDVALGTAHAGFSSTLRAKGWIAVGDVAISPLLAFGGLAAAPIAVGAVTLGIASLSLWGVAVGLLAFGSVALGSWAFGVCALGWQSAVGAAAIARDYALGGYVNAAEANTAAAEAWFAAQWFTGPVQLFAYTAHWIIVAIVLLVLGRLFLRARTLKRLDKS